METTERNRRIGQKLRELRENRGWSQNELARKMTERPGLGNFYPMTIKRIEAGERPIKLDEAMEFAYLLGISLDVLVAITDDEIFYQRELEKVESWLEEYDTVKNSLSELIPRYLEAIRALRAYSMQVVSTRHQTSRTVIRSKLIAKNPLHFWEILRDAAHQELANSFVGDKTVSVKDGEKWATQWLGVCPVEVSQAEDGA